MKKGKVVEMINVIDKILIKSTESSFNWILIQNKTSLIQNKTALKEIQKSIEEYLKPSDRFNEYEKKRIELCVKYCNKDETGNPKLIPVLNLSGQKIADEFDGLKDNAEFQSLLSQLTEEYQDVKDEMINKQNFYETTIKNEEVEVNLKKISIDKVPNILTGTELEILSEMIE